MGWSLGWLAPKTTPSSCSVEGTNPYESLTFLICKAEVQWSLPLLLPPLSAFCKDQISIYTYMRICWHFWIPFKFQELFLVIYIRVVTVNCDMSTLLEEKRSSRLVQTSIALGMSADDWHAAQRTEEGRPTRCGCHHPIGLQPELNKKGKKEACSI